MNEAGDATTAVSRCPTASPPRIHYRNAISSKHLIPCELDAFLCRRYHLNQFETSILPKTWSRTSFELGSPSVVRPVKDILVLIRRTCATGSIKGDEQFWS
ncbi:hypothetical protein HGRIS_011602 [Hohenbuehelia grisea]|uniref:Uncharacterized protein n=1 Tax=Hohenbuehelia grisea TaxID=104357 RepID=A0ABR3JVN3_9AGAR